MTFRQEVCVTLCSFTEENLWKDWQPLCVRQRDHTFLIKLERNRRQSLSNLVSKLRCAEEAKCEVAFIGMKSKVVVEMTEKFSEFSVGVWIFFLWERGIN